MIYFDNSATTKYKPDEVYEAFNYYLKEVGVSPGRGSYSLGIEASRMLYKSRCSVGRFFGMTNPERVVFTKNSTEAINLFLRGVLCPGDHVIISPYEHNAVLRPIHYMKENNNIDYSVISRDDLCLTPEEILKKYMTPKTRLIVMTLASNLTGRIVFNRDLFRLSREKKLITLLDSSQGAGKIKLNMKEDGIDYLAFTGHKDLYALPGVGGLCCESNDHINPLIQGGTGIHGEEYTNPNIFPDGLEAGTLNMPAIWSLNASLYYLKENEEIIKQIESELTEYLLNRMKSVSGIHLYDEEYERVSTCCFTIDGVGTDTLTQLLDKNGIFVRGGIHCAILAHRSIGTEETGAVRISLNYKNTKEEIDTLIDVLNGVS